MRIVFKKSTSATNDTTKEELKVCIKKQKIPILEEEKTIRESRNDGNLEEELRRQPTRVASSNCIEVTKSILLLRDSFVSKICPSMDSPGNELDVSEENTGRLAAYYLLNMT